MSLYPVVVLMVGAVEAYLGLENLLLLALGGQRMHLWLGLTGLLGGLYCCLCFGMYSAPDADIGGRWQLWQLVVAALLADLSIMIGLQSLDRLRRIHLILLIVPTVVLVALMWVPGMGLREAAVKQVAWLGVVYNERTVGFAPQAFFIVGTGWMSYVAVLLLRQAWRGRGRDRAIAGVFWLWYLAGMNDMAVSSGIYSSIYLVEYTIFFIVVVGASLLVTAERRTGQAAERARRQLALEVMAKDRVLAQAQAELTEAAKLAAVGRLSSGVAHEVNNPLTYVVGNLQLLERELREDEELVSLASEALHGARRIQKVVRQLSSFARAEPGGGAGRVDAALDSASKMATAELKDRAQLEVALPTLPMVRMDEGQLAQVLLNLLINAAQAIPPGDREGNRVRVEGRSAQGVVELSVQDTGGGIPARALPHLFEPFFTTKEVGQGAGLGLAISRELVRKAGGQLFGENVPEGGARFTIQLPPFSGPPPAEEPPRATPVPVVRRRLLLVDDDSSVLQSMRRNLDRLYAVTTASGGKEALRLLGTSAEFDVILCDLLMPEGSGLDVLEDLRRSRPQLVPRLVMMTGGVSSAERAILSRDPAVPLLEKPVEVRELLRLLEERLAITPARSSD